MRLFDTNLTGNMGDDTQNDCTWNVILYQSMSGDSEVGNSTFEMDGGTLTTKNGGMFYTTNTESIETVQGLIRNSSELVSYIQENILPDYDKFVSAGEQYNDDAVYIHGVVEKFYEMSDDLRQRTVHIMDYIENILCAVRESSEGINLAASNTANLSGEISNISGKIMQNKVVADELNAEAEHFM